MCGSHTAAAQLAAATVWRWQLGADSWGSSCRQYFQQRHMCQGQQQQQRGSGGAVTTADTAVVILRRLFRVASCTVG
jgi:hypothetical protein